MTTEALIGVGIWVFVITAYCIGTIVEYRAKDAVSKMDLEDNADARYDAMVRPCRKDHQR